MTSKDKALLRWEAFGQLVADISRGVASRKSPSKANKKFQKELERISKL